MIAPAKGFDISTVGLLEPVKNQPALQRRESYDKMRIQKIKNSLCIGVRRVFLEAQKT